MTTFSTRLIRLASAIILGFGLLSCSSDYEFAYLYRNLPFDMEKVHRPQIPPRQISVADYGGVGDGVTLNTDAFAKAIDVLVENGGGRLVVPKGVWLTGPITLKDNIELHVEPDAVLLFSTDRNLYPIVETVFEGLDTKRCLAPINADGAKNIAIDGWYGIDYKKIAKETEEGKIAKSFIGFVFIICPSTFFKAISFSSKII